MSCTSLFAASGSTVANSWLGGQRRLHFCYTAISCHKGINCPVSLALDSYGQWIDLTLEINACHIFCVKWWCYSHQLVKAHSYLHWEIYLKINFYKKKKWKIQIFYQSTVLFFWQRVLCFAQSKHSWWYLYMVPEGQLTQDKPRKLMAKLSHTQ